MMMRKKLACCTRDMREISLDFDEQDRMTMYNGLESRIINSHSFDNNSGTSRGVTESFDDDYSSCSSSNNASGSFSSLWTIMKRDDQCREDCRAKETPCSGRQSSDDETMKERFAKLLLGEDITGGTRGISAALALSNAISNLAASVFGELWKLEPLADEGKRKWRKEMDWLLSPTNYMVELVPTTQDDTNGHTLEIMTPKARADIHMNLPALRKLDSMLIETLDSMASTEFWYEGEGRRTSDQRWFPSPCVPSNGLSDVERKRLLHQGKLVYQVFKAAKTINENVLVEMPIPTTIKDALPKSGKASLGEELYKVLAAEPVPAEEMINCLNLKSENAALDAVNRLEAAVVAWKRRIEEHGIRMSWSFLKDHEQTDELVYRAEVLLQQIKTKHPSLPRAFLDVTRVEYGKDVGHAILEAYSRVLANLALSILSRIGDVLQEDVMSNPNSPVAMSRLVGAKIPRISDSPMLDRLRHSLVHQLNAVDAKSCDSHETVAGGSDAEEPSEAHIGSARRSQEGG